MLTKPSTLKPSALNRCRVQGKVSGLLIPEPLKLRQKELVNVQQIQATSSAFAAMSADGTIVTWGDPENGGLR